MTSGDPVPDTEAGERRLRHAVRRAAARLGGLRKASGASLAAVLSASALAPVVAAGLTQGPVILAGAGFAGAVGAGVLTEVITSALDGLREGSRDEDAVKTALAATLEAALAAGDGDNGELRKVIA